MGCEGNAVGARQDEQGVAFIEVAAAKSGRKPVDIDVKNLILSLKNEQLALGCEKEQGELSRCSSDQGEALLMPPDDRFGLDGQQHPATVLNSVKEVTRAGGAIRITGLYGAAKKIGTDPHSFRGERWHRRSLRSWGRMNCEGQHIPPSGD